MITVKSKEEFIRAVSFNEVVFVNYYSKFSKNYDVMLAIGRELAKSIDSRILVIGVDVDELPELATDLPCIPCLRVYFCGKVVFEQLSFFNELEQDVRIIRRGVRSVFRDLNINYRV